MTDGDTSVLSQTVTAILFVLAVFFFAMWKTAEAEKEALKALILKDSSEEVEADEEK